MIPQMAANEYQTYFNYLTFGIPPVSSISIACENCHSKEVIIISHSTKKTSHPRYDEINGEFTFYCPYCFHIEKVTIESICIVAGSLPQGSLI